MAAPSASLLDVALGVVEPPSKDEELYFGGPDVPASTVVKLLRHAKPQVRAMAAVAEWRRERPPSVRPSLTADWEVAVLDIRASDYTLAEIFKSYPSVASKWAKAAVEAAESAYDIEPITQGIDAARPFFTRDGRRELLDLLVGRRYQSMAFDLVVGNDATLFADWLRGQPPNWQRLRPLQREWSPRWEQFLLAALNAGCIPEEVAEYCTPIAWGYGGPGESASRFRDQLAACEKLLTDPDTRLHPAARAAAAWALARVYEVEDRQRAFEADGH